MALEHFPVSYFYQQGAATWFYDSHLWHEIQQEYLIAHLF
jgi:hypothetical protein